MQNHPNPAFFEGNKIIDDGICKFCTSHPKDFKAFAQNIGNSTE